MPFLFKTRLIPFIVLAVSGLLSACGDEAQQGPQHGPVPVSAITITRQAIEERVNLPGRTNAFKIAEIRPQVTGVIQSRTFTEGEEVKKGQQLYLIDPAIYKANYESAKAALQRAKANVQSVSSRMKRYEELVAIDAVSRQEYDDIKASYAQAMADVAVAEANVETAKVNLNYTKVYSPISGRIGKSSVTEGALVTANQADVLARVTQLDPIYVDMSQAATELMNIRKNADAGTEYKVRIFLEDGTEYQHLGTLQFSEVVVDETTGSVQLRAIFPNPERVLMPGLFVQAEVILGERNAVLVPQQSAIRNQRGDLVVWKVENGTANPHPIKVAYEYGDKWVVTEGLSEGDVVVTEGFQKIQPGAPVQVAGAEPAAKPQDAAKGEDVQSTQE